MEREKNGGVGVSGYMQTRLSSNMQEPALLWHKSASELRQRERSSFDSKWVRDSCQRHRGRLHYPTENWRLIGSDQFGMSHIEWCGGSNCSVFTKETLCMASRRNHERGH